MPHRKAVVASVASLLLALSGKAEDPPAIAPCGDLPAAVRTLGTPSNLETFGVAPEPGVAVATSPAPGQAGRSLLTFTRGGAAPRTVLLSGRAVGLAVSGDGNHAFVIVRSTDRKGYVRSVELASVDLATARAGSTTPLPATARGLAYGAEASTLLVACKDELRTFQLPQLTSGPLYRVPGDNVGVAALPGSSLVLIAQPERLVLADLAEAQGRDGLTLTHETVVAARLRAMMAGVGDPGPIALADGGTAWCVRLAAFAVAEPAPKEPPVPEPPAEQAPSEVSAPPSEPAPTPASASPPIPEAPAAPPEPAPAAPLQPTPPPPVSVAVPTEPGSLSGSVAGPGRGAVAAIIVLGPNNVLREAARVVPDDNGRFSVLGLPVGTYRVMAAGLGGHVLICDPSFVTIRVSSNSAVEVPVLNVLRAQ